MRIRISILLLVIQLTACTSFNSVQPFDHHQAALLLQQSTDSVQSNKQLVLSFPAMHTWQKLRIKGYSVVLLPPNQTPAHWMERIETTAISRNTDPHLTANQLAKRDIIQYMNTCESVTANTLLRTPYSITYTISLRHCDDKADQVQIAKIFNAPDGIYSVKYIALQTIATKEKTIMFYAVQQAQLL